jgi:hypothetical protein
MAILQYGDLAEFAVAPAKAFFLPAMLQPAAPDLFRRHFVTGEYLDEATRQHNYAPLFRFLMLVTAGSAEGR